MRAIGQHLGEESVEVERRLVAELLRLKECSGLSYEGLAERTGYSRSSWQRFLNGGKPPTRAAVEQLAEVAGGDRDRLLALWEYARESTDAPLPEPRSDTDVAVPAGAGACEGCRGTSGRPGPARWTRAVRHLAMALALVASVAVSVFLSGRYARPSAPAAVAATAAKESVTPEPPATPQCRGESCEGQEPTAM
ncbi:helix-turn-helix domain-containing protein, partial [Streptomyces lavendulae]